MDVNWTLSREATYTSPLTVIAHTEKVTGDRGNVIGLGRVGNTVVVGEQDTLRSELLECRRGRGSGVIGILHNGPSRISFNSHTRADS